VHALKTSFIKKSQKPIMRKKGERATMSRSNLRKVGLVPGTPPREKNSEPVSAIEEEGSRLIKEREGETGNWALGKKRNLVVTSKKETTAPKKKVSEF